jgi:hypothetical protein
MTSFCCFIAVIMPFLAIAKFDYYDCGVKEKRLFAIMVRGLLFIFSLSKGEQAAQSMIDEGLINW